MYSHAVGMFTVRIPAADGRRDTVIGGGGELLEARRHGESPAGRPTCGTRRRGLARPSSRPGARSTRLSRRRSHLRWLRTGRVVRSVGSDDDRPVATLQEVVIAVYHAGGESRLVLGDEVVFSANVSDRAVDVALAEAVEVGLLERAAVGGRVAFALTGAGVVYVEDKRAPMEDRPVRALLVGGPAAGVIVHVAEPPPTTWSYSTPVDGDAELVQVEPGEEFPVMRFSSHVYVMAPEALHPKVNADIAYAFHQTTEG